MAKDASKSDLIAKKFAREKDTAHNRPSATSGPHSADPSQQLRSMDVCLVRSCPLQHGPGRQGCEHPDTRSSSAGSARTSQILNGPWHAETSPSSAPTSNWASPSAPVRSRRPSPNTCTASGARRPRTCSSRCAGPASPTIHDCVCSWKRLPNPGGPDRRPITPVPGARRRPGQEPGTNPRRGALRSGRLGGTRRRQSARLRRPRPSASPRAQCQ